MSSTAERMLGYRCEYCNAAPGEPCVAVASTARHIGRRVPVHTSRIDQENDDRLRDHKAIASVLLSHHLLRGEGEGCSCGKYFPDGIRRIYHVADACVRALKSSREEQTP